MRASWRPTSDDAGGRRPGGRSGLRRLTATYGWRVLLVPVLVVVTALVVVDTTSGGGSLGGGPSAAEDTTTDGADGTAGAGDEPVVEENPAEPIDLDIPTAELPDGGEYTEEGEKTWQVVPLKEGDGDRVGDAERLYTYTVEVEDGLDPASFAGADSFAAVVEGTLSDPRSWAGTGDVSLQRVGEDAPDPDFRVSLTSPATAKPMCGSAIQYEASCRLGPPIDRVVINLARYVRGALAFNADLTGYRQYVINHEVGHALKHGHVGCAAEGELAPVMMQQTFGVANDYVAELNRAGGDSDSVQADGKTCEPNAWPNPQAKPE
ncbi:DUF3152 domain-containing protein [Saccharomonospora iraqiensis]|uniref:DUF3152 domain-containing protein n=1 Tax=Saccharomonospora iraqiensis TaxID=52698 RepID=UPI0002F0A426